MIGKTFIQAVLDGEVTVDQVNDWTYRWHANPDLHCSLAAYIGLTDGEYARWITDAHVLEEVIERHRGGMADTPA